MSSLQDELSSVKSNLLKTEERRASLEKELEEKEESLQQTQGTQTLRLNSNTSAHCVEESGVQMQLRDGSRAVPPDDVCCS